MPKPNENRTIEWERILARRIKQEREERGWTMERLAQRMTDAGCQMQKSAIAKIESPAAGEKPRRISLDEAVTFANVLGASLSSLLVDPGVLASREAVRLWAKYEKVNERYLALQHELADLETRLLELIGSDDAHDVVRALRAQQGNATHRRIGDAMLRQQHEALNRAEAHWRAQTAQGQDA